MKTISRTDSPFQEVTPGRIDAIGDEYHRLPGISKSRLWQFREDREKYRKVYVTGEWQPDDPSPPMQYGTAVDGYVFGTGNIKVIPREVLSDKGHRRGDAWKAYERENAGYILQKESEVEGLICTKENICKYPYARDLIYGEGVRYQQAIHANDPETGLLLRACPDAVVEIRGRTVLVDLKTAANIAQYAFTSSAYEYGYHVQQELYRYVWNLVYGEMPLFCFVVAKSSRSYGVEVYDMDSEFAALGVSDMRELLDDIAECYRTGIWEKPKKVRTISAPRYAFYD